MKLERTELAELSLAPAMGAEVPTGRRFRECVRLVRDRDFCETFALFLPGARFALRVLFNLSSTFGFQLFYASGSEQS
ncbi:hypothetical protein DF220_03800 [Salinibacterium hongtaonis]|uniref:Uncharacterized protein n=1 Tax=Homoserinimonas hongtaonis TaxID=2079791 RepID=A0A2U1SZM6_9MICO|nr:hypothetical protein DF220_03800 [Salinibacterium hongtaonis]